MTKRKANSKKGKKKTSGILEEKETRENTGCEEEVKGLFGANGPEELLNFELDEVFDVQELKIFLDISEQVHLYIH